MMPKKIAAKTKYKNAQKEEKKIYKHPDTYN